MSTNSGTTPSVRERIFTVSLGDTSRLWITFAQPAITFVFLVVVLVRMYIWNGYLDPFGTFLIAAVVIALAYAWRKLALFLDFKIALKGALENAGYSKVRVQRGAFKARGPHYEHASGSIEYIGPVFNSFNRRYKIIHDVS